MLGGDSGEGDGDKKDWGRGTGVDQRMSGGVCGQGWWYRRLGTSCPLVICFVRPEVGDRREGWFMKSGGIYK